MLGCWSVSAEAPGLARWCCWGLDARLPAAEVPGVSQVGVGRFSNPLLEAAMASSSSARAHSPHMTCRAQAASASANDSSPLQHHMGFHAFMRFYWASGQLVHSVGCTTVCI